MNLIEELGIEECCAIVDGAPEWASHYVPDRDKTICCHNEDHFYFRDQVKLGVEHIRLNDLRTAIAAYDYNRTDNLSHFTDNCTDIRNHDLSVSNSSQNDTQIDLSIKMDIEDNCTDIRNHISPNTKVIER